MDIVLSKNGVKVFKISDVQILFKYLIKIICVLVILIPLKFHNWKILIFFKIDNGVLLNN